MPRQKISKDDAMGLQIVASESRSRSLSQQTSSPGIPLTSANPSSEFKKANRALGHVSLRDPTAGELDLGDFHEDKLRRNRHVWEIDTGSRPYLKHIKNVSEGWPHLRFLADFMEVGTSPINWSLLSQGDIDDRAKRTRIAVLEFSSQYEATRRYDIQASADLRQLLGNLNFRHDPEYARIFVVEDLSRDVIEAFGAQYDIDPQFFRSHINDFLWYRTSDPWVELNDLDDVTSNRSFYNLRYMRPRYFMSQASLGDGIKQLGAFNVLRRLEQDLSWKVRAERRNQNPTVMKESTVGVVRSKASLWIRQNKQGEKGVLGILIVDPTIDEGFPLWGGPCNLRPCPSMSSTDVSGPPRTGAFEDVIHYLLKMPKNDIASFKDEPRALALTILTIIGAEWMTVVSYITTGLTEIEYQLEHPGYRQQYGLPGALDHLHPLRRLLPVYRTMIVEVLNTILKSSSPDSQSRGPARTYTSRDAFSAPMGLDKELEAPDSHLGRLRNDFANILDRLDRLQIRTQNIIGLATTIISIEENQRAMKMNVNLVRVTYLAVIFVPMSFVSSIFSMTPDVQSLDQTFWIYFAVAIPLTVLCLAIADQGQRIFALMTWIAKPFRKSNRRHTD